MAVDEGARVREGQNVAQVHERLRRAILAGEIPAGEATSQVVLSREFGVGRTPLREALRMLQNEGLVVSEPNRRVRIAEFSIDDLEQLYVMRIALETVAARITIPSLGPEDIAEMEGLIAQMDHLVDVEPEAFSQVHASFHARFVVGAGERPATLIAQLFDHAERYRLAFRRHEPNRWPERREEHRRMVEAARSGDGDQLADAIAVHYLRTAKGVADGMNPERELSALQTTVAAVAPGAQAALD
jgi:DNA-binding GntR family transcriptional regulator